MPSHTRVATPDDPERALFKGIAMDIGKEVAAYIERMYPQAVSAASSTFLLSVRNSIHNEIVAALLDGPTEHADILARLERRKRHRREQNAALLYALSARIETLKTALEPFAEQAISIDRFTEGILDTAETTVFVGWLRNARTALLPYSVPQRLE